MEINDIEKYFDKTTPRYLHIKGVTNTAIELVYKLRLAKELSLKIKDCAILHDIGYTNTANKSNFHPYDGYMLCKQLGIDQSICKVVLLHSSSIAEVCMSGLDIKDECLKIAGTISEVEKLMLDIITYSDIHTNQYGNTVSLKDRLESIKCRYGEDSIQYKGMCASMMYFIGLDNKYNKLK